MALKVKKKIHPDLIRIPHLPLAGFMAQLVLSPHRAPNSFSKKKKKKGKYRIIVYTFSKC